jgi:hypothetical protein
MPDLRGRKFGRFTVIGLFAHKKAKDKNGDGRRTLWIVRMYEARTTRSLRNPKNEGDRCARCRKIAHLTGME